MADKKVHNVHDGLLKMLVPIDDLVPDPENARTHDERNVKAIADSLEQFGQDQPLVVQKEGNIVRKGNGRLLAAKQLGWTHIAVLIVEENEARAIARAIADNRTAELADWDFQQLGDLFTRLTDEEFDLSKLGWEDYEAGPLMEAEWTPPNLDDLPTGETDGSQVRMETVRLTAEQFEVVSAAVKSLREKEENDAISEGRCLELICGDWLSN